MRFIGQRLKEMRNLRGLSMEDLGKTADVAQGNISEYENGKKQPTASRVKRLHERGTR